MNILTVSINHRTAPVELREALHLSPEEISGLIQNVKGQVLNEGLVISTCNRTELYGIPVKPDLSHHDLQSAISNFKTVKEIQPAHFQNFISRSSLQHLFSVASGIDSLLIGDNQIFKQVKDSFQLAEDMQFTGVLMKRVFDAATRVGKRAQNETAISEGAVTVSYAAVQLIEKIFSNLSKKTALVIGTGETGEIAAKHLRDKGIGKLTLTNRTLEKAQKLADELHCGIIPFAELKNHLKDFDIVISATSSEGFIISKSDVESALKQRHYAPQILMDIALPRDIDPASAKLDSVFYHDIDSLNIIVEQNLTKRKDEIPKVEKIIEEELNNFFNWYNSLEVAPTIKNIRDHFELIRAEEVEKNKNRFSAEDQEKLDVVTKRIINKILHTPTVELKKITEAGISAEEAASRISIIREVFGIDSNGKEEKNS